ncbi:two-component sensor histidine kinase (plasmid) [Thermus thermophilus]|uniref:histidine kinase n=1 Tax=Thermus thermophilus TaxID=274 RepID=A0AAD1NZ77_THETH|nr:HAMP domain-containing sensor histidine kinase [Thermus thermophilus]BBL83326.1 two-component sensor histidine kinase [Thermus thermophilus]BBL85599.1 two-component sensor histidine kinase [Thermus thermophilus]BCZ88056.1 two-component sensor histidine kinase [Thermus thermophilus]BCZ90328.1 two-component sensor histidine kinase [Thermus thermophilus]BCZ93042.1 two-component sensor histidine kinase [Thermus thermophilus]
MSLRTRIALLTGLVAFLGLSLGLFLSSLLLSRLALAEVDHTLHLQAYTLLQEALSEPDHQVPPEEEADLLYGDFPAAAWVYRGERLVWRGGLASAPSLVRGLEAGRPTTVAGWRALALEREGLRAVVAQPLGVVEHLAALYLRLSLPLLLLVGLFSGGVAYLLLGAALRSLRRLADAASRFQPIPPLPGRDEVASLSQAFARLLATLKEERAREQAFLALASHELKTPIAAFRVNLERLLIQDRLDREALRRLKAQAERLEALAENLLALSRAGAQDLRLTEVNLFALVSEVFDRFQPLAVAQGRELLMEGDPVWMVADPRLLERALNNLVQNALLHGRGVVRLRVGREGEDVYLEVEDQGPGPAPRAEPGLGLRVARQVAEALGGKLLLRYGPPFRARLLFRLPSDGGPTVVPGAERSGGEA